MPFNLRIAYRRWDAFLCRNTVLQRIIYWQHKHFPLPFSFFCWLFSSKWSGKLLNFYGSHCFNYYQRQGQDLYWLSRESLYWHFWRQTDMDRDLLKDVFLRPELSAFFYNSEYTCLEIGFGIGKSYKYWLRDNNYLKKYTALELNRYACDYARKAFREENFEIYNQSLDVFIQQEKREFNIVFAANGVLMYCSPDVIDAFCQYLGDCNVKVIIIWNEGSVGDDIVREDGTIMYGFEKRLAQAGVSGRVWKQPQEEQTQLLKYFIMIIND